VVYTIVRTLQNLLMQLTLGNLPARPLPTSGMPHRSSLLCHCLGNKTRINRSNTGISPLQNHGRHDERRVVGILQLTSSQEWHMPGTAEAYDPTSFKTLGTDFGLQINHTFHVPKSSADSAVPHISSVLSPRPPKICSCSCVLSDMRKWRSR
jgi:hypothetical protein